MGQAWAKCSADPTACVHAPTNLNFRLFSTHASELKLVTDNLLFTYAEANWETTEKHGYSTLVSLVPRLSSHPNEK